MRKVVLTFGFIAGAVLSVMMVITFVLLKNISFDAGAVIGYTTMVMAFLMVFFGVKSYRDNVAGGRVGFGRALVVGLLIVGVASVCYVATWEVIFYKVAPDFGERYAASVVDRARKAGATEAQVAARQKEMAEFTEKYKNPAFNVAMTFLEPLPVGIVIALVSAGVLSRKRRSPDGAVA